jgi:hypothetical protein
MSTQQETEAARNAVHGSKIDGNEVVVEYSKEKAPENACYNCGRKGHLARDCQEKPRDPNFLDVRGTRRDDPRRRSPPRDTRDLRDTRDNRDPYYRDVRMERDFRETRPDTRFDVRLEPRRDRYDERDLRDFRGDPRDTYRDMRLEPRDPYGRDPRADPHYRPDLRRLDPRDLPRERLDRYDADRYDAPRLDARYDLRPPLDRFDHRPDLRYLDPRGPPAFDPRDRSAIERYDRPLDSRPPRDDRLARPPQDDRAYRRPPPPYRRDASPIRRPLDRH